MRVEDRHMTTCKYKLIECENDCRDDDGETPEIFRKDLETHLEEECPKRIVECEHCDEEGEYHIITGDHLDYCPGVLEECQNEGCEEMVERCELYNGTHDEVCEYQLIYCKYEPHGCDTIIKRKDMPEHEEDLKLHLEMALEINTDINKRLDLLEKSLSDTVKKMQIIDDDVQCLQQQQPSQKTLFALAQESRFLDAKGSKKKKRPYLSKY